jgi:hypothetical protein
MELLGRLVRFAPLVMMASAAVIAAGATSMGPPADEHELVTEPKLVCYYTNWAKDRPDPWSYVS